MESLEFHEAANIFPLDDENLDSLAEDIRKNKLLTPIETLDGKIIDGRRRWHACRLANVKPTFKAVKVDDPVSYVLSLNLHRRHLSETQRAMVGAKARSIYDEAAKERQKKSHGQGVKGPVNLPDLKGDARDAVGKALGVSGKSIDYARNVLAGGTPKLIAAVESDKVAVSTASRMASSPAEEQDAWVDSASKTKRPRIKEVEEPEPETNGTERKGKGVILANEAINCLIRIPKNDALRKRGLQIVTDWIKKNR